MKVITLLNKIANGEEVPKKIKYKNETLTFEKEINNYIYDSGKDEYWTDYFIIHLNLNDEVEIIEEPKEKEGFVTNGHRFVPNENGVPIFPIEEDKEIEELREYINCGFCGTCEDYERKDLSDSFIKIGNKVNELVRAVNELKKGK